MQTNQHEQSQNYLVACFITGNEEFKTHPFVAPRYASTEVVQVLLMTSYGDAFDAEFVFLGTGCLKLRLPAVVVEKALGWGMSSKRTFIEFVGKHNQ